MLPSKKQVGCCTLCGREVFDVLARWPSDHPLAGEVRQIGAPFPSARCCRMVLMSGAQCTVTLCSTCKPTPDSLPKLWTICGQANAQEMDRQFLVSGAKLTDHGHVEALIESTRKVVVDLPIAVLSTHRWEEDDEFAARSR
jgi:hypothetical protein